MLRLLASKTDWSPLVSGGTNFCTRRFTESGSGRLEFRATLMARLFPVVFGGMGLIACLVLPVATVTTGKFEPALLMPMVIGLVFVTVAWFLLRSFTQLVVFDLGRGVFYKGAVPERGPGSMGGPEGAVELHRIKALQLIREHCSGNKSSFYSYELNLVLDDASRLSVVDHGSRPKLREDAGKLAARLGVPVWDAC